MTDGRLNAMVEGMERAEDDGDDNFAGLARGALEALEGAGFRVVRQEQVPGGPWTPPEPRKLWVDV